jgi:phage-related protein
MKKKTVLLDNKVVKELNKFSLTTQAKFCNLFEILEIEGKLIYPFSKKLNSFLLEIRISDNGQFRVLYTYKLKNIILILSAFQKKTQKTPRNEIKKAIKRLEAYENK